VGANPTAWFVVITFLSIIVRFAIDYKKEVSMKARKTGRKTHHLNQAKLRLNEVIVATAETSWVIMTGLAAVLVTPSVHAKGAPLITQG
jgi:hypothetical protein